MSDTKRQPRTFDPDTAGPKCRHCGYYRLEHFGPDELPDDRQQCPAPLYWGGGAAWDWRLPDTHYEAA